jgi:hypothetical protein
MDQSACQTAEAFVMERGNPAAKLFIQWACNKKDIDNLIK